MPIALHEGERSTVWAILPIPRRLLLLLFVQRCVHATNGLVCPGEQTPEHQNPRLAHEAVTHLRVHPIVFPAPVVTNNIYLRTERKNSGLLVIIIVRLKGIVLILLKVLAITLATVVIDVTVVPVA